MRGDIIQGQDLLKIFGLHPDQMKEMREKLADKLKCKPDQVLDVLRAMDPRSSYLNDALERLEEARRAKRDRIAY